MDLYLTIMITVLVLTQVIRLIQNVRQLKYLKKKADREYEIVVNTSRIGNNLNELINFKMEELGYLDIYKEEDNE